MNVDFGHVKFEYARMTLLEWRRRMKLTQETVALSLGVEQSLLSRWERGLVAPTIRHAQRIISATQGKVTLADLVRVAPVPKPRS
jgi:transcriptional regulator with XRE-family HTH domain